MFSYKTKKIIIFFITLILVGIQVKGTTKSEKELENRIGRLENKLTTQKNFYETSLFIYSTVFSAIIAVFGIASGFVSIKYFRYRLREFDKKIETKYDQLTSTLNDGLTTLIAYNSSPYDVIIKYLSENECYNQTLLAGLQSCFLCKLGMKTANDDESLNALSERFSVRLSEVREFMETNIYNICDEEIESKDELISLISLNIQNIEMENLKECERNSISTLRFYFNKYLV
jgi:hypothetical protein